MRILLEEKQMNLKHKLIIRAFLTICGVFGIVWGSSLGLSNLGAPWSFITGFSFGILSGLGATLSIAGLIDNYELNKQKIFTSKGGLQ